MARTTRITEKGQATIPKPLREKYALEAGDEVQWEDTEGGIIVRKASRSSARGMLLPEDVPRETREEIAAVLEQRVDRHEAERERRLGEE